MVHKVIFLDRDGVINRPTCMMHTYIRTWKEFEFLPGAVDAIRLFNQNGYLVIVISNQRGIARGMIDPQELQLLHKQMRKELNNHGACINAIYVCPHEINSCTCRKPQIGLFLQAENKYSIDKANSWMIGDSETDIIAGKNYGIRTVLIGEGIYGQDFCCPSLLEAAMRILGEST